ncbi:LysR family transcriptional regulator [Aquisalimonas asiatica]|uniref:DNA-binding transcriptional regulator, LysR family n=1 Tax=Aquisalimonas asiatica TaxID=406100 RepID=A0A1H8RRH3_9GAMM|nr:LysR family transcriptional regulator [Aquisalimonas asiatica]SEO68952.1 DNA-binding transcriptional regulator, LysR family [Aquisalimonas asiatica]
MHIERMDLNLFVVFEAIYTEGGITAASGKLHLTQPAVSHALGRLRDIFGDPLFEREGRRMVPTPLARNLIGPVREALRGLEIGLVEADRFDPESSDRLFTLGVRDVLETTVLPPLMAQVRREAPGVRVSAVRADRRRLESELAAGSLDAAVDIWLPLSERVCHKRLVSNRLVVLVRHNHPIADGPMSLDTYLAQDHVVASSRRAGPGIEDVELSRLGLQRTIRLRCQHYFAACRVVSETDLVLTIPERYAQVANQAFGNRVLPLPMTLPQLDSYLYWHANVDSEPANLWLRRHLESIFDGATNPG